MSTLEVDKIIPQSGTATQVGENGDTINVPSGATLNINSGATIANNGTATGFDTDTNDKVKVSANDTTAGFLNGKLVAGTNISLTEGSDGGNETLTAALTGTIATAQIADDAVTLAKMAPGTDGNIISYDASGNPVAVATGSAGQVLTSAGAGAPPTFAAAGGITEADLWRVNTSFTGTADPIASNWERADEATAGYLGTGMSQSSGVFTFPSTGIWKITFVTSVYVNNEDDRGPKIEIDISSNSGGAYIMVAQNFSFLHATSSSYTHNGVMTSTIVDVTNASTFRARFVAEKINSNTVTYGDSSANKTYAEFIRLGDT
jgi:hypothetical protein